MRGAWRRLLRRTDEEARLAAELRDHFEREVADRVRAGASEAEARRATQLAFGGLEQVKEACRDVRGTRWLEDLVADLRHGARLLRKSPAFTLVAVCSLALGIGANTAIFTLVDRVLLRTLPVPAPDRLALLDQGWWSSNPVWEQIRDRRTDLFAGAMAWSSHRFDLAQGGPAELVEGLWVSGEFFEVLGVPALLGRTFHATDDRRGGGAEGPVAVISHAFWQRRFGGAADAVGRSLTLERVRFTVIGITPPQFFGPTVGRSFDVAVPLGAMDVMRGPESWLDHRDRPWLDVMVRLRSGQTVQEATNRLRAVQPQIRAATLPPRWRPQDLATYLSEGLTLVPAATGAPLLRSRYQGPLLTLVVVVGLILLIACANVANLLLVRAIGRQHEFSVRLALGASRLRLARQFLAESLLLAGAGAALGLALAHWGSRLLVALLSTPRDTLFLDLALDGRVLGFTAAVAIGTALLAGIAPAFRTRRAQPAEALKEHGRNLLGDRRRRRGPALGDWLMVAQVALSLVLVVAAGLFGRTFAGLATRPLGLQPDPVLLVNLDAARSEVAPADRPALLERVRAAVEAVPGVSRAGISWVTPLTGTAGNSYVVFPDGPALPERDRRVLVNGISPGWFATYGTMLRAGREFDARDRAGAPVAAIVNEAFVRKYLRDANPLGRRFRQRERPGEVQPDLNIVGVVEDAVYRSPRERITPTVYLAMAQGKAPGNQTSAGLGVRTARGSPLLLMKSVTAAVARVDRNLSLTFRPLGALVDGALVRERTLAWLSAFFGALGLLLAAIGLYGTTSHAVSRRRTEIGIRVALGASAGGVAGLVLGRVAALIAVGVALGGALSLWASRFVRTLLYGLEPNDPATLLGAAAMLAAIAGLAAWFPARRAAGTDPARVLREG